MRNKNLKKKNIIHTLFIYIHTRENAHYKVLFLFNCIYLSQSNEALFNPFSWKSSQTSSHFLLVQFLSSSISQIHGKFQILEVNLTLFPLNIYLNGLKTMIDNNYIVGIKGKERMEEFFLIFETLDRINQ